MTAFVTKKISSAKILGQTLKAARAKKEATIEQAERETKICAKYLLALEEGQYNNLPAEAYNIGFVRLYAGYLGLNQEKIVGLYRAERSAVRLGSDDKGVRFSPRKVREWNFLVTPKLLAACGTLLLIGSVIGYIGYQLNRYNQPPRLDIANNQTELTSSTDLVTIQGQTSQGAVLTLNAEPIPVTPDGQFSEPVQLSPGLNEFILVSRNRVAKESSQTVKVIYNPDLAKAE